MNYNINLGGWNSIFAVPSDVVDKYIKIASGSNIKVLLYFLRHCGELLNDEIIATALSMNEEDVKDALSFWVQVGLLTMSDGVYSPMQAVPEAARPQEKEPVVSGVSASVTVPSGVTAKDAEFAAVKAAALRSPEFSPAEIADTIKSDDKICTAKRKSERKNRENCKNSLFCDRTDCFADLSDWSQTSLTLLPNRARYQLRYTRI